MPLIGGFAIPFNGFREIFFYAIADEVAKPKGKLGYCKSLISSFAIPYNSFRVVFFYAIAVVITRPK